VAQCGQPALDQIACISGEGGDISDHAKGNEVESAASSLGIEQSRKLVGNANSRERAQWVTGGKTVRVDDGLRIRQTLGEHVMIGDEDLCASSPRMGDRIVSGSTSIAGQQHSCAAGKQCLDALDMDAMPFLPGGYVKDDVCMQGAQAFEEQGRRCLAVGVQVSPNRNAVTPVNCLSEAVSGG
jgi:hypothetical protein